MADTGAEKPKNLTSRRSVTMTVMPRHFGTGLNTMMSRKIMKPCWVQLMQNLRSPCLTWDADRAGIWRISGV